MKIHQTRFHDLPGSFSVFQITGFVIAMATVTAVGQQGQAASRCAGPGSIALGLLAWPAVAGAL
ncbi:hypothetical protein NOVOSPHI9U_370070 [Novosphingobium sp. 9U]|nr:hypothetical protein NOVOSPHI9U_370070 [Novosphingobium sp. 9U]